MKILNPTNKQDRIDYICKLYAQVNPEGIIGPDTLIKNTTISKLCEVNGGPYQRIKKWCEDTLQKREVEHIQKKPELSVDMEKASEQFHKCFELMKSRNLKYGDSYTKLRTNSIIDLMLMKLDRCQKQELDDHAMEVEIEDVVNYGIFCLMNIRNK